MAEAWVPERLPEDVDAERALLATLCAPGNETKAAEIAFQLTEEDFVPLSVEKRLSHQGKTVAMKA